jgi:hypothetical protein
MARLRNVVVFFVVVVVCEVQVCNVEESKNATCRARGGGIACRVARHAREEGWEETSPPTDTPRHTFWRSFYPLKTHLQVLTMLKRLSQA